MAAVHVKLGENNNSLGIGIPMTVARITAE